MSGIKVSRRGVAQVTQLPLDTHWQAGIVGIEQLHPFVGLVRTLADGHNAIDQWATYLESVLNRVRVLQTIHYDSSEG